MAHRGAVRVVAALRPNDLVDLLVHQLTQHAEPDAHAQGEQSLSRGPGQIAERDLHPLRQRRRLRAGRRGRDLINQYLLHGGSSCLEWTSTAAHAPSRSGRGGRTAASSSTSYGTTSSSAPARSSGICTRCSRSSECGPGGSCPRRCRPPTPRSSRPERLRVRSTRPSHGGRRARAKGFRGSDHRPVEDPGTGPGGSLGEGAARRRVSQNRSFSAASPSPRSPSSSSSLTLAGAGGGSTGRDDVAVLVSRVLIDRLHAWSLTPLSPTARPFAPVYGPGRARGPAD